MAQSQETAFAFIQDNWAALRLGAFGTELNVDHRVPQCGGTHELETSVAYAPGNPSNPADPYHGTTAVDRHTPLDDARVPLLAAAWRYLIGP